MAVRACGEEARLDRMQGMEEVLLELTKQQAQAIAANGTEPTRVVDPTTQTEYVLVRAEVYDRIKRILAEDEAWAQDAYTAALEVFARDGWDDPRMDVYDALDPRRPS